MADIDPRSLADSLSNLFSVAFQGELRKWMEGILLLFDQQT